MSRIAIRLYTVILSAEYPPIPPQSCRYSPKNITPSTAPSTCQLASSYQLVKVLTSLCFPPETHQPDNTQHGQEKIPNSIMIVIIIIISIRWIYIYSFSRTSPSTASPPTPSSSCQLASSCQVVKVLTSPPASRQTRPPAGHTTRAGKDSQYKDYYYNSLYYKIDIYIKKYT